MILRSNGPHAVPRWMNGGIVRLSPVERIQNLIRWLLWRMH